MYHETESKHHSRGHLGPILYITCIRLHPEISPYTTFYQRKVNLSRTKILNSKLPNPKFTRNISFHYGKINPEGKFYIPDYLIQNVPLRLLGCRKKRPRKKTMQFNNQFRVHNYLMYPFFAWCTPKILNIPSLPFLSQANLATSPPNLHDRSTPPPPNHPTPTPHSNITTQCNLYNAPNWWPLRRHLIIHHTTRITIILEQPHLTEPSFLCTNFI